MIKISVCMIVKNEENVLRRCLESLKGIWDELIVVDTGSTDATKAIAGEYTDKIYDFEWINDFSAARNYAMSKATMDYIYMADADEVIDEANISRFIVLKENLLPEIEIVEMWYANQLSHGTVYNFDRELRPKLYKRLREFTFIDPVHETVRLDPVVYESDVEIMHLPEKLHTSRDIAIFEKEIERRGKLSDRLLRMYAKELMISGESEDLIRAKAFFEELSESASDEDTLRLSYVVLSKINAVMDDAEGLLKYALKDIVCKGCSETCTILGAYYEVKGDLKEASVWYYNARYEVEPELNIIYKYELPLKGLARIYKALGDDEAALGFEQELENL